MPSAESTPSTSGSSIPLNICPTLGVVDYCVVVVLQPDQDVLQGRYQVFIDDANVYVYLVI